MIYRNQAICRSLAQCLIGILLALGAILAASACGPRSTLLLDVGVSREVISPNGDGIDDETIIRYSLSADALISIFMEDAQGKRYPLHERQARTAGSYSLRFRGAYYLDSERRQRRVIPDGTYTFHVIAEDERGNTQERTGRLVIQDADTRAPEITEVTSSYDTISPNGDAEADETNISFALSKDALVTIYALDERGTRYILDPPRNRAAALQSFDWNGTFANRPLPDGRYEVHIQAEDKAGNISEAIYPITIAGGGTPRLEITKVEFTPHALPVGGILNVKIKVKNTGDTPIKTLGPPPGTPYETSFNFLYWKRKESDGSETALYYERPGVWRVGVSWSQADRPYPVRWGLTPDLSPLLPGQEAVITGTIKVLINQVREIEFWAGVEQGGVGFPGGQKGLQKIIVSY